MIVRVRVVEGERSLLGIPQGESVNERLCSGVMGQGVDRGEGGANDGAARVIPLVATAVLMAMFRER